MKRDSDLIHMECEEAVVEKIRRRRDAGRAKYGETMERKDLDLVDWLRHAQEKVWCLRAVIAIYRDLLSEFPDWRSRRNLPLSRKVRLRRMARAVRKFDARQA